MRTAEQLLLQFQQSCGGKSTFAMDMFMKSMSKEEMQLLSDSLPREQEDSYYLKKLISFSHKLSHLRDLNTDQVKE